MATIQRFNKAGLRECPVCRAKVKPSHYSIHVSKCGKRAVDQGERKLCPFNALHCVSVAEYEHHLLTCPDSKSYIIAHKQRQEMRDREEILRQKNQEVNNNNTDPSEPEKRRKERYVEKKLMFKHCLLLQFEFDLIIVNSYRDARKSAPGVTSDDWDRDDDDEVGKDVIYEDEEYDPEASAQRASKEKAWKMSSLKVDHGKMSADDAFNEYLKTKKFDQLIINRMAPSEKSRFYMMVNEFHANRYVIPEDVKPKEFKSDPESGPSCPTSDFAAVSIAISPRDAQDVAPLKLHGIGRGRGLVTSKAPPLL